MYLADVRCSEGAATALEGAPEGAFTCGDPLCEGGSAVSPRQWPGHNWAGRAGPGLPVWVRTCFCKSPEVLKALLHSSSGHLYGFSPVWVRMWLFSPYPVPGGGARVRRAQGEPHLHHLVFLRPRLSPLRCAPRGSEPPLAQSARVCLCPAAAGAEKWGWGSGPCSLPCPGPAGAIPEPVEEETWRTYDLRASTERENEVQREATPPTTGTPHWSLSGLLLASMTGFPPVTLPCSWSTETAVSSGRQPGAWLSLGNIQS